MSEMLKQNSDLKAAEKAGGRGKPQNASVKLALELGPLALFFFANARPKVFEPIVAPFLPASVLSGDSAGLFIATLVLMAAVVVALIASFSLTRRIPFVPLMTAVLAVAFGALTLYLHDATFIKMKPTVLYVCFSAALFGGLAFNRPVLPILFDHAMALTEDGWRVLTLRWATFFLVLAAMNEIVWRTQATNVWVAFKFPGLFILVFLFTLAQLPFIMRNKLDEEEAEKAPEHF
ncbi:putative intracellular septation protein A [Methylocella tundrae]|uniref:Inner membrane-spanning protein YciB n=1 Tax=Methylocella tundrae TaxID=227605 RepID=A0A4U8Z3S3_METTU|nr:septation protein A [Methylocella tundrae]VFU10117.1 putative intracellular septation protein A [Methylocella tundrae]